MSRYGKPVGGAKASSEPAPNFDRIARLYRWAEYLCYGRLLERVRSRWLGEVVNSRYALVLGDGDGRFLASLLPRSPDLHACAVDTSAAMLALLRARCERQPGRGGDRLQVVRTSALMIEPSPETDLVVSHFFLDCLRDDQVCTLAARLAQILQPGARWLVSDFDLPRSAWLRPLARGYLRMLYAVFRLLTGLRVTRLPDISAALRGAGFVRLKKQEFAAGMLYSELWRLRGTKDSQTLSATGATGTSSITGRPTRPMNQPAREITRLDLHDAQPDPEPPVPSLREPDPGVFHRAAPIEASSAAEKGASSEAMLTGREQA